MSPSLSLRKLSAGRSPRSPRLLRAGNLQVERFDGIIGLQTTAIELDAVNEHSAKPSPFATSAFTIAYASNSERDPLGMDVRLFVVRDDAGLALGWAVFAFRIDELAGVPEAVTQRSAGLGKLLALAAKGARASRLELMTTSDVDRPGIVARIGYEDAVAEAMLAHLIERELDWTLLEWRAQERGSPLWEAAFARANPFLRVRDVELDPYSEVHLQWPDVDAYFRALSKRMRSNVSRQARKLYASGRVELVLVNGSEATAAFFDAYGDLETRSWKHHSEAAMGRHPLRLKFYSRIVSGEAGIEPSLVGIALDGVLIAALINGRFGDRMWSMEMAFDESLDALGPGQLLLLLAVMDGLGKRCKSLNFFQMHGYFKRRWLANELPVANVQILRRPSLHDMKGLTGDAFRWSKTRASRNSPGAVEDEQKASNGSEHQGGPSSSGGQASQGASGGQGTGSPVKSGGFNAGGFNAMKRAAGSEKLVIAASADAGQVDVKPLGPNDVERQRELFTLAVQRARGVNNANDANVRVLDATAASAVLPFAVR
jgi:Acetyltransferase (GNAT) domain